jgi:hypothetical protein
MIETDALIAQLTDRLEPVQPLRKPWLRAVLWSGFATVIIALLGIFFGARADIAHALHEAKFVMPLLGSWLTGLTAALAAFSVSLPDRSRRWLWLPLPPVLLWSSGFAYGCLANWIEIPEGADIKAGAMDCIGTILLVSAALLIVLLPMLRRVKTLRPGLTAWLALLAVSGFADTAHLLVDTEQASLLALTINLVPALILVPLAGLLGRRIVV